MPDTADGASSAHELPPSALTGGGADDAIRHPAEHTARGLVTLRYLAATDEPVIAVAQQELAAEGFEFLLGYRPGKPWEQYLDELDRERRGQDLRPGRVAASYLVAEVSGDVVGRVSIRHSLNPFLEAVGGHIGYAVRPHARRRGYATQILDLSLVEAHDLGIGRALVTCDPDNDGSRTVIERCGGVLDEDAGPFPGAPTKLRYWIATGR